MNIAFCDFWPGFNSHTNFFSCLLRENNENINIVNAENADILFYSCFGQNHKKYNCKKVFYTGENIRPNFSECNYSLTFDFESYNNKNIRLPLWYLYIDWFNVKTYNNPKYLIPVKYLIESNEFTIKNKNKFCSFVYSSHRDIRKEISDKISLYKQVDLYGKIHNKHIIDGEFEKFNIISEYKFNICVENTNYPGYFTEKLLHAKIAGCIPIYYSDKTYINDFNEKCCLNLINYENIDQLLEDIKIIDNDTNKYNNMLSEPLFNLVPNVNNIYNDIKRIL